MKEENKEEEIAENIQHHQASSPTINVNSKHNWKQRGPNLICDSCESLHGIYIGNDKIFKGYNKEGNIIIENKYEKK